VSTSLTLPGFSRASFQFDESVPLECTKRQQDLIGAHYFNASGSYLDNYAKDAGECGATQGSGGGVSVSVSVLVLVLVLCFGVGGIAFAIGFMIWIWFRFLFLFRYTMVLVVVPVLLLLLGALVFGFGLE
jgi:hypothetical protein